MAKLTDPQLIILAAAAKRDDGAILPLPKKLKLDGDAADRAIEGLLAGKLIVDRPAGGETPVWRKADDGEPRTLTITSSGLREIGADSPDRGEADSRRAGGAKSVRRRPESAKPAKAGRGASKTNKRREASGQRALTGIGTKQDTLIEMLRRPAGASIQELVEVTSWQPHSVRGVISGVLKKKFGLKVISEMKEDGERRYSVVG